jgi:hypothetical protein
MPGALLGLLAICLTAVVDALTASAQPEVVAPGVLSAVFLARVNTPDHCHSWVEFGFDGALYFRRTTPDWSRNVTMRAPPDGDGFGPPGPFVDVERWKDWRADVRVAGGTPGPTGASCSWP